VVLYPQAIRTPVAWYAWFAGNPQGCWDWWDYSGPDYLSRTAPPLSTEARMAAALGASLQQSVVLGFGRHYCPCSGICQGTGRTIDGHPWLRDHQLQAGSSATQSNSTPMPGVSGAMAR
jgi:hypothetical protein